MFCRIALVLFLTSTILYPVQTVEVVTEGSVYLWHWLSTFNIEFAKEMAEQGIQITNDALQHREMQ